MDQNTYKGVNEKNGCVQVNFRLADGQRLRISVTSAAWNPGNAERWNEKLNGLRGIKAKIKEGTFILGDEFPDYRFMSKVAPEQAKNVKQTLGAVWLDYVTHCEQQIRMADMSVSTLDGYRKAYNARWKQELAARPFFSIQLSDLRRIADKYDGKKKGRNNVVSVIRCIFKHGYENTPQKNPALGLQCLRLKSKDRPEVDPYNIGEAETLIAAIYEDHGAAQGAYDEFRFFTGLRPSEQIALNIEDFDQPSGTVDVSKVRVCGQDQGRTKTGFDRRIELNPRALAVLRRWLRIRAEMVLAGKIRREERAIFVNEEKNKAGIAGARWHDLQVQGRRWNKTHARLKMRQRDPYTARHSSVSWNLMLEKNILWVSAQHGHSVATMLKTYARWTKGTKEGDIEALRVAFGEQNQLRKAA